ncbi:MAG TPA: flagellar basal body rod protein FlgB [Ktedonobacterales bacterium]|nr:flagellar basal body rod protein FlgB [Ktedonobacterales bacterium]
MIPGLFDATMQRLSYGLDGLSQRQQIIADNIANVDTPGYLTHDIPFEQQLLDAMNDPLSTSAAPTNLPDAITRNDLQVRNDGNNVAINMQMNEMTGTAVTYEAATQLISQKFGMLSDALAPIN